MPELEAGKLRETMERVKNADCLWLSYVRPPRKPETVPMWHIWKDDRIHLATQQRSLKVRCIRENPRVSVHLPDPLNVVIIDGLAQVIETEEASRASDSLSPSFSEKYGWDLRDEQDGGKFSLALIVIEPVRVVVWGEAGAEERQVWSPVL